MEQINETVVYMQKKNCCQLGIFTVSCNTKLIFQTVLRHFSPIEISYSENIFQGKLTFELVRSMLSLCL